jgi:glycolate oxidase iron-sulfur subunit
MHTQPNSNANRNETGIGGSDFVSRLVENGWPEFAKDAGLGVTSKNPAADIPYDLFLQCIHCGMCTSSCPTFTLLGDENDGPRGRIQIMRTVADGKGKLTDRMRQHLDLCLDCRACETACPSGVEYSKLVEPFRLTLKQTETRIEKRFDWFREIILFQLFPYADRMRLLLSPVRLMQWLGIYGLIEKLGLFKLVPGRLGRMVPLLPSNLKSGPRFPKFLPAIGRKRARVAFFTGCVADAMFRPTHWATIRVLQQNGCDVFIPTDQACCGAIHYHAGDSRGARKLADQNLVAFELDRYDAIIVNHGGCGAMLKEYGHYWHDGLQPHRAKFSEKVKDVHEFLDELGLVPPSGHIEAVATYHDSCHLRHAQGIEEAPRKFMEKIPGLVLKELPEASLCCGSAGTYNLNEPKMADCLGCRKVENILTTEATIALAANAGCLLQIMAEVRRQKLPLRVMHTMDLLDMSYRGEKLS